jgi:hypothetical protein
MASTSGEFAKRREHTIPTPPMTLDSQLRRLSYDPRTGKIDLDRVFHALRSIYDDFGARYPWIAGNHDRERDPNGGTVAEQSGGEQPGAEPDTSGAAAPPETAPTTTATRRRGRAATDASNQTGRTNKAGKPITVSRSEGSLKTWETRHAIRRYMEEHKGVSRAEAKAAVKAQQGSAPPRQRPAAPPAPPAAPPPAQPEPPPAQPAPAAERRRVVTGEARKPTQEEIRAGITEYLESHPTASREEATAIVTARLSSRPTIIEAETDEAPADPPAEPPIKRGLKGWHTRVQNYIERVKRETGETIDEAEAKRRITGSKQAA